MTNSNINTVILQLGTLHDELYRRQLANSPLPQARLLSIFSSICLAVHQLHHSTPPLSHRDIKVSVSISIPGHSLQPSLSLSLTIFCWTRICLRS